MQRASACVCAVSLLCEFWFYFIFRIFVCQWSISFSCVSFLHSLCKTFAASLRFEWTFGAIPHFPYHIRSDAFYLVFTFVDSTELRQTLNAVRRAVDLFALSIYSANDPSWASCELWCDKTFSTTNTDLQFAVREMRSEHLTLAADVTNER